ncbi:MAG TPA: methyl-accepting chemotaxis protein [Candidatus Cybelea sp.]|nr:methyl-accepting chemotaxis protein [Candidatus Cybelea sp.]
MTNLYSRFSALAFAVLAGLLLLAAGLALALDLRIAALGILAAALLTQALAIGGLVRERRLLDELTAALVRLKSGDLEARVARILGASRIELLAWEVNDVIDRADAFLREATASLDAVSHQRYYRRIVTTGMLGAFKRGADASNTAIGAIQGKIRKFGETRGAFEANTAHVVEDLSKSAAELAATANQLKGTAGATSQRTLAAFEGSSAAKASLESVASATEQLNSSIDEINKQIHRSVEIAHAAKRETDQAGARTESLIQAAERVRAVVALIKNIADDTNLIALNATIEASRAGEAGRGFAVVANEVKNLANQSARAADEITGHVGEIEGGVDAVAGAIRAAQGVIQSMDQAADSIAAAMEEQSTATREIARSLEQALQGASQVAGNMESVRTATDETEQSAARLAQSSARLETQTGRLSGSVSTFLEELKAVV